MGIGKKKTFRDQLKAQASDLGDALAPRVENARDKAVTVAGPYVADARAKASDAYGKAAPYVSDARDKAAPYVSDARDKAAPVLADARDKARDATAPLVSDAKDKWASDVLPVVTAAIAAVEGATEEARDETKKRGKAVAAALKGEVEAPEKKHRVRNFLVVLGLGGAAFAVFKKLSSRQPTTSWQSSYTPPPAPTPPPAGGPVAGAGAAGAHRADPVPDDDAAADPGEAASDAADVPHPSTTPDNPVEEIQVDKK